jgi:hypothetical protein
VNLQVKAAPFAPAFESLLDDAGNEVVGVARNPLGIYPCIVEGNVPVAARCDVQIEVKA